MTDLMEGRRFLLSQEALWATYLRVRLAVRI